MPRTSLAALVVVAACGGGESPIETAIISPVLSPCIGFGPHMCMNVAFDGGPSTRQFFGIEGYDHRWGVESEITLRREVVENPPADGSSQRLILEDTIVENDIPLGAFDLEFPAGPDWFSGTGTEVELLGTTIECELAVCDELRAADQSAAAFTVDVELVDADTLRATGVGQ